MPPNTTIGSVTVVNCNVLFPKDGVQADIFERMSREGWNPDAK